MFWVKFQSFKKKSLEKRQEIFSKEYSFQGKQEMNLHIKFSLFSVFTYFSILPLYYFHYLNEELEFNEFMIYMFK